jgi:hypothetical protein
MIKKRIIKKQIENVTIEVSDTIPSKVERGFGRAILKKLVHSHW